MQPTFTTRPDIRGTFGAVASTHWLATQTGMAVLERGGNAFDAAVAAGFVLQIVEPHLNGPGGELPAIVFRAGAQAPEVICGQGPFPANATVERLTGMGLAQMPGTGLLLLVPVYSERTPKSQMEKPGERDADRFAARLECRRAPREALRLHGFHPPRARN